MGLALDEPNTKENPLKVNGIDVLISDDIKDFADKSTIDYADEPNREGFTVKQIGKTCC